MFYYLLYNSSFSFIVDNRLFSTILYGSILYILTHAILNYCSIEILTIINHYFWIIFILDVISLLYGIYQVYMNPEINNPNGNGNTTNSNDLSVSFNLLKNKINTLLDRKNDLTITQIPTQPSPYTPHTPTPATNNNSYPQQNNSPSNTPLNTTQKMSTPISQLQKQKKQIPNANTAPLPPMYDNIDVNIPDIDPSSGNSTPINLIRTRISSNNPEPIINEDGYAESVAGSDLGSIMDLDDFEKTL
jgi:hypothetical protein